MSAVRNELERLLDDLPEEDLVELVAEIRGRAGLRAHTVLNAQGHVTGSLMVGDSTPAPEQSRQLSKLVLRWPKLGPAALGAGVLLGWAAGLAGGPLAAILGVAVGLVLGDRLDQHNAAATTDV